MKTRKEAEVRAMELFPPSDSYVRNAFYGLARQAFLQCWEEMQKAEREERMKDVPDKYRNMPVEFVNKQTCGFCVEPKN